MDLAFTPDQELLRRSVREFAEREMRPHVREWDDAQQFPRELLSKLAGLGLMGIQVPEEFGGAAMSSVDYCICIEELARVDPSVSLTVAAHNGLGAAHIAMFGSDEQKRKYLTPLARGHKLAAWGLTEASAGSDAGAGFVERLACDRGHEAVGSGRSQARIGEQPVDGREAAVRVWGHLRDFTTRPIAGCCPAGL